MLHINFSWYPSDTIVKDRYVNFLRPIFCKFLQAKLLRLNLRLHLKELRVVRTEIRYLWKQRTNPSSLQAMTKIWSSCYRETYWCAISTFTGVTLLAMLMRRGCWTRLLCCPCGCPIFSLALEGRGKGCWWWDLPVRSCWTICPPSLVGITSKPPSSTCCFFYIETCNVTLYKL